MYCRHFKKRYGNGFTSCYMCASKEKYSNEFDSSLYTDVNYGLPICYKCIVEKMNSLGLDFEIIK